MDRADLRGAHLAGASLGVTTLKRANLRGGARTPGGLQVSD
ncbi:pentapeptide repeat-containing protein [Streptomyces sp.]